MTWPTERFRCGASLDHGAEGSDPSSDDESELLREMYWARDTAARASMDTPEIRDHLHDFAAQMRTDEAVLIPMGEGNLVALEVAPSAQAPPLARDAPGDLALRPPARRPRRAHDEPRREGHGSRGGGRPTQGPSEGMPPREGTSPSEVAVPHPQTAFVRGGAETHTESLVRAPAGGGPRS